MPATARSPKPARRTLRRLALCGSVLVLTGLAALLVWVSRPCPGLLEDVPFSRCILDREGNLLRLGLAADGRFRVRTRLTDLPPEAVRAVVRYEDRFFWYHPGINPLALARAAAGMLTGGRRMGGSTLTMQVARLRLGLRTGSVQDKLRQMLWALRFEWHFSKTEILEAYFNLAPYGGNVEGLGAAARIYFHCEPRRLTTSEILSLVPVPQNPVVRTPSSANRHFLAAAARLQGLRAREGAEQILPAGRFGLRVHGTADLPFGAPHLSTELLALEGSAEIVRSTIDPALQALLERQVRSATGRLAPFGLGNAAALLVHWPSREVLALVGSGDFFSPAISGQIDATAIRRSPGSTLKPFIYALALEQGLIHPKSLLTDLPRSFAGYEPENFDGTFQGPLAADEALRLSRNVPAISLANRLRAPGLYGFLRRANVHFDFSEEHYGLSLVLGGAEVSARELAALYAMLADQGLWKPLVFTLDDRHADRQALPLLTPEAAFVTLDMLVSDNPENRVRCRRNGAVLPLRLKTGTSNGLRDAWTCGIVGPYVLVVWLGNFDNSSNPLLVGARTALPLFRDIARALAARTRMDDVLTTPPQNCRVRQIAVCTATGDTDTGLCADRGLQTTTWFIPGVSPVQDSGILRRVRVDRTTGLRTCPGHDADSEVRVLEFWPSELRQLFARAGVAKAGPPPFLPACRREQELPGMAPRIALPKQGMVYHARQGEKTCPITLLAHTEADAGAVYWFCDADFLGVARPGVTLLFQALPGDHVLRVVDDAGRSATRRLVVRRMP